MKRRNTMGVPRALDATRARRASQAAAVGQVAGKGQAIDASGRIVPAPDGPGFFRGPNGELNYDLGFLLHLPTGSPRRLSVDRAALIAFLNGGWATNDSLAQSVSDLTAFAGDLDGGEADTWATPDVVLSASLLEPFAEFDGGSA